MADKKEPKHYYKCEHSTLHYDIEDTVTILTAELWNEIVRDDTVKEAAHGDEDEADILLCNDCLRKLRARQLEFD